MQLIIQTKQQQCAIIRKKEIVTKSVKMDTRTF